jgi:hypothetical protein
MVRRLGMLRTDVVVVAKRKLTPLRLKTAVVPPVG